ncbi:MAG: type I DNA topoisomerase [bacterium]
MQLVIVESPAKSRTISQFLGPKYKVLSSYGHVRDLPESKLGVDVENNFEPQYVVMPKAKKNVEILKKEAKKADLVILAVDEDREGEAIAFHLSYLLNLNGKKEYKRIVFHEITKPAITAALKNPRKIDMALVDAQQARRILDRIVGYKLSPFLWKKVARGLSAGRVQSVAVRFVVEREREIKKFVPQEYWPIVATLLKIKNQKSKIKNNEFEAALIKKDGKTLDKLEIKNKKEADKIVKDLEESEYRITNIEKKEVKRNPLPPFTTSTLQQTAWQKFKFPAKLTMRISQQLYETGKITYHRTDSLNLSQMSLFAAKKFITEKYGKEYWPGFFRKYKAKGKVQEAHEAIRPSYPNQTPELLQKELDKNQLKLYELIWERFIACQMNQAVFDATTIDIAAKNYTFRTTGQILKFEGFLKVYRMKFQENDLPPLKKDEVLELIKLTPSQHFTQPPPRYNEASLIKVLEENGIGRPSTYAPTLSTIQDKNYIEKNDERRFQPTEIGFVVNDILVKHFPEIVDAQFTAEMETELDKIAGGERKWVPVIKEFYKPFEKNLEQKYKEVNKKDITEKPTEKTCPKCSAPLLIRLGKYGKFYACSKFPKCRYTESLQENLLDIACPKCLARSATALQAGTKGKLTEKRTKKRKIFYGCNQFPKCDFALWDKPTGDKCPKCSSLLIQTKRNQVKCSSKECGYLAQRG